MTAGRPPSARDGLGLRAQTIAWGVPVVALCLWRGGWVLAAAAAALSLACLQEFWALGRPHGTRGRLRVELAAGAVAVVVGSAAGRAPAELALVVGLLAVWTGGVVRASQAHEPGALAADLRATVWATAGLLYVPWLLGYVVRLRADGPQPLADAALTVGLVWAGDVAAYLVGSRWGRRRLAPRLSPGKTWEGSAAALAVGVAAGAALGPLLAAVPSWGGAVVGAATVALGQAGDLWESACKRAAGVKDSGAAVPGHGGVLDRFDSLLFAAPAAYWLLATVHWR